MARCSEEAPVVVAGDAYTFRCEHELREGTDMHDGPHEVTFAPPRGTGWIVKWGGVVSPVGTAR